MKTMKGITPVIAIILLLLITISMVGFAFVWFSRVTSNTAGQIETQTNQQFQTAGQRVSIEAIDTTNSVVTVRNTGTATVDTTQLVLYVSDAPTTCAGTVWPATIAVGATGRCDFSVGACAAGTNIRVTAPGGQDSRTC